MYINTMESFSDVRSFSASDPGLKKRPAARRGGDTVTLSSQAVAMSGADSAHEKTARKARQEPAEQPECVDAAVRTDAQGKNVSEQTSLEQRPLGKQGTNLLSLLLESIFMYSLDGGEEKNSETASETSHSEKGLSAETDQENTLKKLLNDVASGKVALSELPNAMAGISSDNVPAKDHTRRNDASTGTLKI